MKSVLPHNSHRWLEKLDKASRKTKPIAIPKAIRWITRKDRDSFPLIRRIVVIIGNMSRNRNELKRNWRAQSMKPIPPEAKPIIEENIPKTIKERIQIPDIGSPQKSPSKRMNGAVQGYFEGTLIRSNVQGPIIATSSMIKITVRQMRLFLSGHNIFCFPHLSTDLSSL
jgi:hypothetical protein